MIRALMMIRNRWLGPCDPSVLAIFWYVLKPKSAAFLLTLQNEHGILYQDSSLITTSALLSKFAPVLRRFLEAARQRRTLSF